MRPESERGSAMFRDALLIAGKDLRIEARSRVVASQVLPFAILALVLFAFALDADRAALRDFSPGLFWVAVLFAGLLAIQRTTNLEHDDSTIDALRLSAIEPSSIFAGKTLAITAQLLALEVLLVVGIVVFYAAEFDSLADAALLGVTSFVSAVGVAAAGTLYGALTAGIRGRETLLPILLLPVLAPVLIGATRAFDDALGSAAVNGWAWLSLLGLFAVVYLVFGLLAYGILLEES